MTKFFALFGSAIIFSLFTFAQKKPSLEILKSNAAVKHDVSTPIAADKPLIKPAGAAVEQTLLGSKTTLVFTILVKVNIQLQAYCTIHLILHSNFLDIFIILY